MMKAVVIHEFGGPEVMRLEEVAEPRAGAGEIRIRVIAAGVNPADWKMRANPRENAEMPMTLGLDVAGVVDQVGEGMRVFAIGERVFAKTAPPHGGYAEYVVVQAGHAARMPHSLGFVEAAAIPTAGLTAWQALFDTAHLEAGHIVLIHGAAGGVGSFAVQFAKWREGHVIGTASGDHLPFVKNLGADEVIDYKNTRFEDVVHGVDIVLDTVGGETLMRSLGVLKPGGMLVTLIGPIPHGAPEANGVRAVLMTSRPDGHELSLIATLIDEGTVKPMVTTVLPLTDVRQAHEMSETRHMHGKIVLRVAEEPARGAMAA
ncbi:MAG: NADP-dependent oxidoreductase [Armatimonadota bacterium]